jgi:hypothetical protein
LSVEPERLRSKIANISLDREDHVTRSQVKTCSSDWPAHIIGGVDNIRQLPSNLK